MTALYDQKKLADGQLFQIHLILKIECSPGEFEGDHDHLHAFQEFLFSRHKIG
jgi:hypothetical protein